jgi:transposase
MEFCRINRSNPYRRFADTPAVGHAIFGIIYHILSRKEPYQDLGANYFDERDRQAVQRRLVRRLEQLGYQVTIQPAPTPTEASFSE